MHAGRRVALVVPALDEAASVAAVVQAFRARPALDLAIVVDNGSRDATAERARAAGALVVHEARRGYGAALATGIEHALGLGADVVVLTEGDGTFSAEDLEPLLDGLAQAELVLGSRTAAMHGLLGLGNRLVAGLLVALWPGRSCPLSDVGCTLRAFTAEAWTRVAAGTRADGPEFSPRMIGAAFRAGLRVREIPVRYGPRSAGHSRHTGSLLASARTATRMLRAILRQRLAR